MALKSLNELNFGKREVSTASQYKTIKIKRKLASILTWLSVLFFLLSLIATESIFFWLSFGIFIVSAASKVFLRKGLLDLLILRLS
jgi:hypothetical protein